MLSYNSVKRVICHNSGLESISKFFRLVINRLVYLWQCSGCFIGWKDDCSYRKQKEMLKVYVFPLLVKYFSPPAIYDFVGFSL